MEIREDKKDWMVEVLGTERYDMLERIIDEYGNIANAMGIPNYEADEVEEENQPDADNAVEEDGVEEDADEADEADDSIVKEEEAVEEDEEAAEEEEDKEEAAEEDDTADDEDQQEAEDTATEEADDGADEVDEAPADDAVALDLEQLAGIFKEFTVKVGEALEKQAEATNAILEKVGDLEEKVGETEEFVKEYKVEKEQGPLNTTLAAMLGTSGVLDSAVGSREAKLRANSVLAKDDGPKEQEDVATNPIEAALASIIGI